MQAIDEAPIFPEFPGKQTESQKTQTTNPKKKKILPLRKKKSLRFVRQVMMKKKKKVVKLIAKNGGYMIESFGNTYSYRIIED